MQATTTAPGTPAPSPARSPWPYALVAFFAVFISFIFWFISVAVRQRTDLVRPDYYDQEIRYQQQIDRLRRTAQPGLAVRVALAADGRGLAVALPAAHAADFGGGTVSFYRPSDARQDRQVALRPGPDGTQSVPVDGLRGGLWRVQLAWKSGGAEFYHEQSVMLPGGR